jgi:membrane fusion protein
VTAHQPVSLFRPEVLAARKDRLHGDISLAVPLSWHLIGYLMAAAIFLAFCLLAFASYARVENVNGAIVVDKGVAAIVPTRPGVISELAVKDGQHVSFGDTLAHVRSDEDLAGGGTAAQRGLDSLAQQDRQLASQAALVLSAAAAERARLQETIRGAEEEIEGLDRQIADQQQLIVLAESQFADAQSVAAKGFISRRDLDDRQAAALQRRQQIAQLKQARSAKLTSIADARRTIAEAGASAQAQAQSVESQRSQLDQQIAQLDAAKGYALTSPVSGTITALTARPGQPVTPTDQLMVVIPDGGRMRVELYVPTRAAGFLKQGQEVRLAIDAFPYQTFGVVDARIRDIPSTVIAKQTDKGPVPIYLVTAELARDSVKAFGKAHPLVPGMTLTARIVTRRQSLFEWLFEPLFAVSRR